MPEPEPLTTYLELRQSTETGEEVAGLSHKAGGLFLLHVLEIASFGEPRGGVTLIHDVGEHGGRYVELARALARERWAVALPDTRGHGRSEGARGHSGGTSEMLRDLAAVQDHLAYRLPDAPKALVGVGAGAIWALAYALENPGQLEALVMCAPRWQPAFELPKPAGGLLKAFKKVGPTAPGRIGNDPARLCADSAVQAAWRADALVHDVVTLRAGEQLLDAAQRYGGRTAELEVPTLVLHGADDALSDPAYSRARAAGKLDVRVIDGLRHDLFHGAGSEGAIAELAAWLAR